MNVKIEKKHEGETLFAVATGNNATRFSENKPIEVKVIKVKRVYVDLEIRGRVDSYDPTSGATQKACNSGYSLNAGYRFYESLDDIANEERTAKRYECLLELFRWSSSKKLTPEQIDQIYEIAFPEGD